MPLTPYTHDEGQWAIVRTPNGENPDVTPEGTNGYSGTRRGVTFVDGESRIPLDQDDNDNYTYCKEILARFAFDDGYTVVLPTGESLDTPKANSDFLEHRADYRKIRSRAVSKMERPVVEAV